MAPHKGLLPSRPRSDSGAVRLWQWSRRRRRPWTIAEAASSVDLSLRRTREIVAAMQSARLLRRLSIRKADSSGRFVPAKWITIDARRAIATIIITSDKLRGRIIDVRPG